VGDLERWKQVFLHSMLEEYPPGRYENWPKCEQLEPHIAQLVEIQPADAVGAAEWAQLLTNVGWYGLQMGGYDRAMALLWKAVKVREVVLGAGNSVTITSVNILAGVLGRTLWEFPIMNSGVYTGGDSGLDRVVFAVRGDDPETNWALDGLYCGVMTHDGAPWGEFRMCDEED
jgi:hypothetical protein